MDETQTVATINMDMLDKAVAEDSRGTGSVMDQIHSVKVYNPKIGEAADVLKANRFRIKEKNGGQEVFEDGPIVFNPLDVSFYLSGSVYPITDGEFAKDKVFFYTNEFGKYAKKTDVIGFAAQGKPIGFFAKGDFENMLKTPRLNGQENQFYDRKKDKDDKPYNGSLINRGAVIYGTFQNGDRKDELFRMMLSPNHLGITFRDGEACDPERGTFDYAVMMGLDRLNELLAANGKKTVSRINPEQCDIKMSIIENDRKNFLPFFEFVGLVAERGQDNSDMVQFVKELKAAHFESVFGEMGVASPISIADGNVRITLAQLAAPKAKVEQATIEGVTEEDAMATFDNPVETSVSNHKKSEGGLKF